MKADLLPTRFLPAERSSAEEIARTKQKLLQTPILSAILDELPLITFFLEEHRQIVLANQAAVIISPTKEKEGLYGLRLGELINCVHADETEGGCGTTQSCTLCGAGQAIFCSQQRQSGKNECRVLRHNGEAMDLRVWASPFSVDGKAYTMFSLMDITDEKRRRVLERLFFHDILNMISALQASASMMKEVPPKVKDELSAVISTSSDKLLEEIEAQKDLASAEAGDLVLNFKPVNSLEILEYLASLYKKEGEARQQSVNIASDADNIDFVSDKRLLFRVLGNMVKNALEASASGSPVLLSSKKAGNRVRFSVHNRGTIPEEVRLQIFQRSFSTKGGNRGLGTYSIKLLTERYLKGTADFTTSPTRGTTF
ncbi:MAG TPA: HAMP domain-containing sensor histidine kinase, partial [Dehalococcoidales bacterium]|nr:HAMP domain-containing sensor histidine kinase [Dehalococcoidales bacterium]